MNIETIIGIILVAFTILIYPIYTWVRNLYFMIDCLLHGGDWQYYRDYVVAGLLMAIFAIGVGLIGYGLEH